MGERIKAEKIQEIGERKYTVVLREGKKREIKRLFATIGVRVLSIKRVRFGKFNLSGLKEGEYREIKINL
jgi:pseudouridine synthase